MFKHWFRKQYPPTHLYRSKHVKCRIIHEPNLSDKLVSEVIRKGKPALIGRIGASEAAAMSCIYDTVYSGSFPDYLSSLYSRMTSKKRFQQLCNLAGVYPINKEILQEFYSEYLDSMKNSDILGCWGEAFTSIEYLALSNPTTVLIRHVATSPWVPDMLNTPGHWSSELEGKKVLVISPFALTFREQLAKTKELFKGIKYPNFEFIPMQAPLTQGGLDDGKSWAQHLSLMKTKIEKIHFDIALVSAGAYANPLANHAKITGKIGINCGGELQLFFGVTGRRWSGPGRQQYYVNDSWVNPDPTDRPRNWKQIENGSYW